MALASLYNVPKTEQQFAEFAFANQNEHFKIQEAIQRLLGFTVQVFPLDPIPVNDVGSWAYNHQAMHNQQNEILGIAGNDLTQINFADDAEAEGWAFDHASEHLQAAQILGLT